MKIPLMCLSFSLSQKFHIFYTSALFKIKSNYTNKMTTTYIAADIKNTKTMEKIFGKNEKTTQ